ncbi:MAG: hypothetical protein ABH869_01335, partial [Candidatus Omnitrophota bacterium]
MTFISHKNKIFKTIAVTISAIFLWNQIIWAAEPSDYSTASMIENQDKTEMPGISPESLWERISVNNKWLSHKQDVETFVQKQKLSKTETTMPESVIFTQTTTNGDVINYLNGAIVSMDLSEGTQVRDIVFDDENNIIDAKIVTSDGTEIEIKDSKIIFVKESNGTILGFDDYQNISFVQAVDGSLTQYEYTRDNLDNILSVTITDSEKKTSYNAEEDLTKVEMNSGKVFEYKERILEKITDEDGTIHLFEAEQNTAVGTYSIKKEKILYTNDTAKLYTYKRDVNGKLIRIEEYIPPHTEALDVVPADAVLMHGWFTHEDGSIHANRDKYKLEYDVDFGANNESVSLTLAAKNRGGLSWCYDKFKIEVLVDDVSVGTLKIPESTSRFRERTIDLGLQNGRHKVTLNWLNDRRAPLVRDVNLHINKIQFNCKKSATTKYYNRRGRLIRENDTTRTVNYTYTEDPDENIIDIKEEIEQQTETLSIVPVSAFSRPGWYSRQDGSVYTTGGNKSLGYKVNAGDNNKEVVLKLSAKSMGKMPSSYKHYPLEIYIDGHSRGTMYLPTYSYGGMQTELNLGYLCGEHDIRIKWLNTVYPTSLSSVYLNITGLELECTKNTTINHYNADEYLTSSIDPDEGRITYTYIKDQNENITQVKEKKEDLDISNKTLKIKPADAVTKDGWYTCSDGSIYARNDNRLLEYNVELGNNNENVKFTISAKNKGDLAWWYDDFKFKLYVDGQDKGQYSISASDSRYKYKTIDLGALNGAHNIGIVWLNDSSGRCLFYSYDANIRIGSLQFDSYKGPAEIYYSAERAKKLPGSRRLDLTKLTGLNLVNINTSEACPLTEVSTILPESPYDPKAIISGINQDIKQALLGLNDIDYSPSDNTYTITTSDNEFYTYGLCVDEYLLCFYEDKDGIITAYGYDENKELISLLTTWLDGTVQDHYLPSKRIYTITYIDNTTEEYSDENWNGRTDKGKLTKTTRPDKTYTKYENYYNNTDQAETETDYDENDNRLETRKKDIQGRLIKLINQNNTYTIYENYYNGTNQAQFITDYDAEDNLLVRREYDEDGELIRTIYPDVSLEYYDNEFGRIKYIIYPGVKTEEYSDEDWNSRPNKGRHIRTDYEDNSYTLYDGHYENTDQPRHEEK